MGHYLFLFFLHLLLFSFASFLDCCLSHGVLSRSQKVIGLNSDGQMELTAVFYHCFSSSSLFFFMPLVFCVFSFYTISDVCPDRAESS